VHGVTRSAQLVGERLDTVGEPERVMKDEDLGQG